MQIDRVRVDWKGLASYHKDRHHKAMVRVRKLELTNRQQRMIISVLKKKINGVLAAISAELNK